MKIPQGIQRKWLAQMNKQYDAKQDGRMSYDLCIDTLREKCIREGSVAPLENNPKEQQWAKEGPIDFSEYESLKN